jgi:hypothetical protein
MGHAFTAFFLFLTKLFSAAEKTASSLNNLATWADESSGVFVDESRHKRKQLLKAQEAEAALTSLPAPVPVPVAE